MRLFVAIEVPDEVRAALAADVAALRARAPELRWVEPERWHLTVAFLGQVTDERVPDVEGAVTEAAAGAAPFTLALDGGAGTFSGRVLWLGFAPSGAAAQLADRLRAALSVRGFEVEDRPFQPHLTLARARQGGRVPARLAASWEGPRLSWRVDRLAVMRSQLHPKGARYTLHSTSWLFGPPEG